MSKMTRTGTTQDDQELVDLVSGLMTDPNLHTDLRMRLQEEISRLLRSAHPHAHVAGASVAGRRGQEVSGQHLPELMQAVLSDPNLHTDMRMRLYQEIPELVRGAQAESVTRAKRSP